MSTTARSPANNVANGASPQPMISVVTPSYNQGRFIERSIRSATDQGYANFEHIVYDNCSTDETVEVLRRYSHVEWFSEPDHGQSDALNKAVRRSRGEIIAWINADDYYEPGAFEIAARELHGESDVKLIAGGVHLVDEAGRITQTFEPRFEGLDYLIEYWRHPYGLCQPGVFFRREVIERVGEFRTDLHFAMDYDFWLRAARHWPVKIVDAVLARYIIHAESKTGSSRCGSGFRDELEAVSRRYWGPWFGAQRRRRARECRRHAADVFAHAVLAAHKHDDDFDWSLVWRLLRRRPLRACDRYVLAAIFERLCGRRLCRRLGREFGGGAAVPSEGGP